MRLQRRKMGMRVQRSGRRMTSAVLHWWPHRCLPSTDRLLARSAELLSSSSQLIELEVP